MGRPLVNNNTAIPSCSSDSQAQGLGGSLAHGSPWECELNEAKLTVCFLQQDKGPSKYHLLGLAKVLHSFEN